MNSNKKKVIILGGGVSGSVAAYYLSHTPELREKLDVTLYQMGWRLGGKGANGRNARYGQRIEEHGLHMWSGFYHNAFHLMREVYAELDRPGGAPLRTFDDAFEPHRFIVWEEHLKGESLHWPVPFPMNSNAPGQGGRMPTVWNYVQMTLGWLINLLHTFPYEEVRVESGANTDSGKGPDVSPLSLLRYLHDKPAQAAGDREPVGLLGILDAVGERFRGPRMEKVMNDNRARRAFIFIDLALTILRGVIRDGVIRRGFMTIDDQEFLQWLRSHGAHNATLESAPLRSFYDYFFAYEQGDPERPALSAAIGLRHLFGLVGGYKGSIYWKLQSGMGDTAFAPLYEICRRNGVRFRFFHEVRALSPARDGSKIDSVRIARQVNLKGDDYDPLLNIRGLPSWPSEPLYEQIRDEEAAALRERGVNLEDPWRDWDAVEEMELQAGRDFDAAVLAIPVGCFPMTCSEILEQNRDWRTMVEKLPTIQNITAQLWFSGDAPSLGWHMPPTGLCGNDPPMTSWVDMSHTLPREDWPPEHEPGNVSYFCGVMPTPEMPPAGKNTEFGREQQRLAREATIGWLRRNLGRIFPNAMQGGKPAEVGWSLLVDPYGSEGLERLDAQYIKAAYTPSDRYVLSMPGASRYRLTADSSGYQNLVLCGDWLFTGWGGCVEAAVMSAMQTARALTGEKLNIVGEMESPWLRPRSGTPVI